MLICVGHGPLARHSLFDAVCIKHTRRESMPRRKKNQTVVETNEINPRDMKPGTKVWPYLRHSIGDNQTLESQRNDVEQVIKSKGWKVDRQFEDVGISGSST